jgi:hypothetical protein
VSRVGQVSQKAVNKKPASQTLKEKRTAKKIKKAGKASPFLTLGRDS